MGHHRRKEFQIRRKNRDEILFERIKILPELILLRTNYNTEITLFCEKRRLFFKQIK